jgi:DNA-binding CsgD family transcriptional regulator
MAVSDRDLRALLGLIETVNGARDPQEFRMSVLPAIRELVPCAYAAYNEIHHTGGGAYALMDPDDMQFVGDGEEVLARLASQNPLIAHHAKTRDGRALQIADFLTEDEWKATEFYKCLFEPNGIVHQMAISLPSQPTLTIGIVVNDERKFAARDRDLLDLARPHLVGAYRNAQLHAIAAAQLRALERGLDGAGTGVAVLGRDGVVHAAGQLVHDTLQLGPRLGDPVAGWVDFKRAQPPGTDGAPLVLASSIGPGSVVIRFLRGSSRREPDLLLVEERADPLDAGALRALGLTQRQADILRLVALGRPSAAIATELAISQGTVRKHLENIYRRLGVTTRGGAAAAAWAGAETVGSAVDEMPA